MSIPARVKHIALALLFIAATINFTRTTLKVIENSKRLEMTQEEVKVLEQDKTALEQELEYKKTAEYIEKEARNKLGLVQPGEDIYVPAKILGDTNSTEIVIKDEDKKNYELWIELFF